MIPYLLKTSLCLSLFWLAYYVLLRSTTFFRLNRFYLLVGIFASFIVPGITLSEYSQVYDFSMIAPPETSWLELKPVIQTSDLTTVGNTETDYTFIFGIIYFAGVFGLLLQLFLSVASGLRLIWTRGVNYVDNVRVVKLEQRYAYTFFNTVFLPEHDLPAVIFEHEKVHVKQWHWIDLLLVEIACVLLWFNPLIFLYRRAIKLQHEYLADSLTISGGVPVEHYLNCLLNQLHLENAVALTHKFHSQPINKRIMMMTRNKTPWPFKAIYMLLIPGLCFLMIGFTDKPVKVETPATSALSQVVAADPFTTVNNGKPSIAPIAMTKANVSAVFGERIHPATGKKQFHTGVDFQLAEGEIVVATASGTVASSRFDSLRGNYIVIKHGEEYATAYFHLKSMWVKAGDRVEQRQKIGYVGSTGKYSTGPHLHYEVIKHGKHVDPKDYLPIK